MQKNKLNNIIVLKELSSNLIEEAIVVLKSNVNFKQEEKNVPNKEMPGKNKAILKEAEYVIESYISQMQSKNKQMKNDKIKRKYNTLKRVTIILMIINIFLLFKLF